MQPSLYKLYLFATTGMGYGVANRLEVEYSGEKEAIKYIAGKCNNGFVFFDVGANIGNYTLLVSNILGKKIAAIHAFEPSKHSFGTLVKTTADLQPVHCYNFGFGKEESTLTLWSTYEGSGGGTIYNAALDGQDHGNTIRETIQLKVLDEFCAAGNIPKISFLKIDVEGHELFVLKGARQILQQKAIQFIQFEFGPLNVYSRTFFKDFWDLLSPNYTIYRIVQDGLSEIKAYSENLEIFRTSNFLAELK